MLIYEVGYVILPLPRNVVKSVFRPLAGANEESGGLIRRTTFSSGNQSAAKFVALRNGFVSSDCSDQSKQTVFKNQQNQNLQIGPSRN
jgi:hypothetical protein